MSALGSLAVCSMSGFTGSAADATSDLLHTEDLFVGPDSPVPVLCSLCDNPFDQVRRRSISVPGWCIQCLGAPLPVSEDFFPGDSDTDAEKCLPTSSVRDRENTSDQSTRHQIRIFSSQLSPLHIGGVRGRRMQAKSFRQQQVALMAGHIMTGTPQEKVDIIICAFYNRHGSCGRVARAVQRRFMKEARCHREAMPSSFDVDIE